jgi:DNA-binding transcriptional LysR family regulator
MPAHRPQPHDPHDARASGVPRRLDEGLIRALHELLSCTNISAAAARLGMSQPAMSRQLRTLREIVGDPLLVRVGNRMMLTPRAESLVAPVRRILADMALLPARGASFDPQVAQATFRLASYDSLPAPFFASLVQHVVVAAPHCSLEIHSLASTTETLRMLSEGDLDGLITTRRDLTSHLHARVLLTDPVVFVVRTGHPLAANPTAEAYRQAGHIGSLVQARGTGSGLESRLLQAGLALRIQVRTQYLGLTQHMLCGSDLVFTTGRTLGSWMARQAPLVALPLPVPVDPLRYNLVWHERTHRDPAFAWFRQQVLACARGLSGQGPDDVHDAG